MSEQWAVSDYPAAYNRREILVLVSEFAPDISRNDPTFRVAAVLMASLLECGPDPKAIAELLGYKGAWVRAVGGRFRAAGVWRGEEVAVEGLADAADFSYRSWRRAVRAGLGTLEEQRNGTLGTTSNRRPRRQKGASLQPNRYSSESRRRGGHS